MWQHVLMAKCHLQACGIKYINGNIYTYLLHESLTSSQLVTKFLHFMEPEGSLLPLQVPATCPYPQPYQSSRKEIYATVIMFRIEILIVLVKIHAAVSIKLYKINK